ncbi:uncharacterized protein METZ01_LOCUS473299, partial [marine metagenome]
MTGNEKHHLAAWAAAAKRDLKERPLESLPQQTPEGIEIKPLYTAEDLSTLQHLDTLPGIPPFVRGPRATMYTGRP